MHQKKKTHDYKREIRVPSNIIIDASNIDENIADAEVLKELIYVLPYNYNKYNIHHNKINKKYI